MCACTKKHRRKRKEKRKEKQREKNSIARRSFEVLNILLLQEMTVNMFIKIMDGCLNVWNMITFLRSDWDLSPLILCRISKVRKIIPFTAFRYFHFHFGPPSPQSSLTWPFSIHNTFSVVLDACVCVHFSDWNIAKAVWMP